MIKWQIETKEQYLRDYKKYEKKHREELNAVLNNLDSYFKALNECGLPNLIKTGFIYNEPLGIKALDQKGGGRKTKLQATRLLCISQYGRELACAAGNR